MTSMSAVNAPPRKDVYLLWGQFGSIGGARVHPRGRLWLLTGGDIDNVDEPVLCRIAWNDPTTGVVVYEDLGEVAQARIRPNSTSAEVWTKAGDTVTFVTAPCVCGAGAVGNALPDEGRISLNYVNPYNRPRIAFT